MMNRLAEFECQLVVDRLGQQLSQLECELPMFQSVLQLDELSSQLKHRSTEKFL